MLSYSAVAVHKRAAIHSSFQALWFVLPTGENMTDSPSKLQGYSALTQSTKYNTWLCVDYIKFLWKRERQFSWSSLVCN